ncbi:MAG: hypothetical protein EXR47_00985 [Dehalococcoidia bacterium]|nr:hypothetical protein [Dehalococcoidia bacterium]
MRVQVFTGRGCAHLDDIAKLVTESVAEDGGSDLQVEFLQLSDYDEAKVRKCFGSPTIRVDGVDIEYGDREPLEYTTGCRYYNTPDGWKALPYRSMLVKAIHRARTRPPASSAARAQRPESD